MKRILIVTYYGLKEPIKFAADGLESLGYIVDDFPLYRFKYDDNDKTEDYLRLFHEKIVAFEADVVLWWCTCISADEMALIKERNPKVGAHLFYNWDDPFMWHVPESELADKAARVFDIVMTCCKGAMPMYEEQGVKQVAHCLPGFSPEVHNPKQFCESEVCDVAFLCTNLYANEGGFPNQIFNRKKVVDALEAADDIDFRLFGPPFLKEMYPRSYRGEKGYREAAQVFASARINLCTHVVGNVDGYANERTVLIMGTGGGVMAIDPVKGIENLIDGPNCFILKEEGGPEGVVDQLRDILKIPEERRIAMAHNARTFALERWTWRDWAVDVSRQIGLWFFDPKAYAELNGLSA